MKISWEKYRTVLKCTQMRARVEIVDVLGWNKSNALFDKRPLEYDPYHMRVTVEGKRIIYPGDKLAPASSLLDSKLILNSTISTPGDQSFAPTSNIIS